jgi:TPR repeat protein
MFAVRRVALARVRAAARRLRGQHTRQPPCMWGVIAIMVGCHVMVAEADQQWATRTPSSTRAVRAVHQIGEPGSSVALDRQSQYLAAWYRSNDQRVWDDDSAAVFRPACGDEAGGDGEQNDERAAAWYRRQCDAGSAIGCAMLGYCYETGRGVRRDAREAAVLYGQACEAGSAASCAVLGLMHEQGRGVGHDRWQAVQLYRKGCDAGAPLACARLGVMFHAGVPGLRKSRSHARALFRRACAGGDRDACKRAGVAIPPS